MVVQQQASLYAEFLMHGIQCVLVYLLMVRCLSEHVAYMSYVCVCTCSMHVVCMYMYMYRYIALYMMSIKVRNL